MTQSSVPRRVRIMRALLAGAVTLAVTGVFWYAMIGQDPASGASSPSSHESSTMTSTSTKASTGTPTSTKPRTGTPTSAAPTATVVPSGAARAGGGGSQGVSWLAALSLLVLGVPIATALYLRRRDEARQN